MYKFIASHVLAPALEIARGSSTMKCLAELQTSQWWTPEKLRELQNERLARLAAQAYANTPYYRRLFDERGIKPADIRCAQDLARLPVLTKQIIRENFAGMTAGNIPAKQRVRMSTGGSTGEPLIFYRTRHDQRDWSFAAAARAIGWAGYKMGDRRAMLSVQRPYASAMDQLAQISKRFFQRSLLFDTKNMSAANMPQLAARLRRYNPEFLTGYPSAIELLAHYLQQEGGPGLKPAAIVTAAEQLYDYQRELFREVYGCESFSIYSAWEAHGIAAECEKHGGFHIAAENVIIEILDDQGAVLPAGQAGRIVLTNLHNYAMPFIRYDMGDIGVAADGLCACGRGLPLLSEIQGRVTDMIVTRDGKTIPGLTLLHVMRQRGYLEQFQIVQESIDQLRLNLVLQAGCTPEFMDEVSREMQSRYREILGQDMRVSVNFTDNIPLTPDGKRRIVISKIPRA